MEALTEVELNKDELIASALTIQEIVEDKPQVKYHSIIRHGKNGTHLTVEAGSQVVIQEKLDGANASFKLENGRLRCFSRNQELDEHNTLRGFYNWVMDNIDPKRLFPNFIYFGEWLCQHKVNYGEQNMNKFYLFDVYSEYDNEYLPFSDVECEAEALEINLIPVLYKGEAKDFEFLQSFVGKSKLNAEINAEGIVVKNIDYKDKQGNQCFTKIVSKEYAEMQPQPLAKAPMPASEERIFVDTFLTQARIEKHMFKLVDEGIIDELAIENMGSILKNVGSRIFQDMLDEEVNELPVEFNEKSIKQAIGKVLPSYVKKILVANGGM
jgi:hypothetical protein